MSLAVFRLETFVCDPSLGCFAWELSLEVFRFETFAWGFDCWIFWLIYSVGDVSLGNFRLGSFVGELSLRILRDLSLALSL